MASIPEDEWLVARNQPTPRLVVEVGDWEYEMCSHQKLELTCRFCILDNLYHCGKEVSDILSSLISMESGTYFEIIRVISTVSIPRGIQITPDNLMFIETCRVLTKAGVCDDVHQIVLMYVQTFSLPTKTTAQVRRDEAWQRYMVHIYDMYGDEPLTPPDERYTPLSDPSDFDDD
jgi:hypothetical protein